MSVLNRDRSRPAIVYPDSDGKPMAENTLQFEWIVTIKEGLERIYADRADVFVAGDLLWYPVKGHPKIRAAPDALVVFGRPKGYRGSYIQFEENGIAPQVVFEVLSPGNRDPEMIRKFKFYQKHGVDEYYIYDPHKVELTGYLRSDGKLRGIGEMNGWISPLLGIRFDLSANDLVIYGPDGQRFLTYQEIAQERDRATQERDRATQECDRATQERDRADQERDRATQERDRATQERDRATQERDRATQERDEVILERDRLALERDRVAQESERLAQERDAERQRVERMAAQLRAMGVEPPA